MGTELTESNQKSVISNQKSQIIRIALIVSVAAAVLAVGHYGFRALRGPASGGQANASGGQAGDALAPGPIQFGRAAGREAADVPRPPRSAPAFAMPSQGAPGRILAEYASQAAPEEVLRFYRAEMPRLGWTERKPQGVTYAQDGLTVLFYWNAAGDSCSIAVSPLASAETAVTILRMTPSGGK